MSEPRKKTDACVARVVPLFPLPEIILFPGMLLPLHVFEPRYRQMVDDLLDASGRLAMGTFLGEEPGRVAPMAGLGQIESYHVLDDGRFIILVRGLERVHVREVASERLYRKAAIETAEEIPPPSPDEERRLRALLTEAVRARAADRDAIPAGVAATLLADILLLQLGLPGEDLYRRFALLDVADRARQALALHAASD